MQPFARRNTDRLDTQDPSSDNYHTAPTSEHTIIHTFTSNLYMPTDTILTFDKDINSESLDSLNNLEVTIPQ